MPPESDTETRINNWIDREDGVDSGESQDTGADAQRQGTGTALVTTDNQKQSAVGPAVNGQPNTQHDRQGQPAADKQQQVTPRPTDDGDLVDPRTGQVVARSGRERRLYEQQRAVEKAVGPVRQELENTKAQLQAFREAAALPTQLGLNPQDVTTAMQFMSHWRRDPVGAAKNMLTELRAAGYNVDELASTVDAGAIRRMVMDAVAPFQQDREATRLQAEQHAAAQREVQQLHAEMPWTTLQERELSMILQADDSLSLREAAYRLHLWAVQNGYDINQPIADQYNARQAQPHGQQAPQQQAPTPQPNMARAPGPIASGNGPLVERRGSSLGHERSTKDIVRESMREAGLIVE